MMAPPLITQERSLKSIDCPYQYSTTWLEEQHQSVKDSLCAEPNLCVDQRVLTAPNLTMSCSHHGGNSDDEYFGLEKRMVQGEKVGALQLIAMNASGGLLLLADVKSLSSASGYALVVTPAARPSSA